MSIPNLKRVFCFLVLFLSMSAWASLETLELSQLYYLPSTVEYQSAIQVIQNGSYFSQDGSLSSISNSELGDLYDGPFEVVSKSKSSLALVLCNFGERFDRDTAKCFLLEKKDFSGNSRTFIETIPYSIAENVRNRAIVPDLYGFKEISKKGLAALRSLARSKWKEVKNEQWVRRYEEDLPEVYSWEQGFDFYIDQDFGGMQYLTHANYIVWQQYRWKNEIRKRMIDMKSVVARDYRSIRAIRESRDEDGRVSYLIWFDPPSKGIDGLDRASDGFHYLDPTPFQSTPQVMSRGLDMDAVALALTRTKFRYMILTLDSIESPQKLTLSLNQLDTEPSQKALNRITFNYGLAR